MRSHRSCTRHRRRRATSGVKPDVPERRPQYFAAGRSSKALAVCRLAAFARARLLQEAASAVRARALTHTRGCVPGGAGALRPEGRRRALPPQAQRLPRRRARPQLPPVRESPAPSKRPRSSGRGGRRGRRHAPLRTRAGGRGTPGSARPATRSMRRSERTSAPATASARPGRRRTTRSRGRSTRRSAAAEAVRGDPPSHATPDTGPECVYFETVPLRKTFSVIRAPQHREGGGLRARSRLR
jgi:hypothetical protein